MRVQGCREGMKGSHCEFSTLCYQSIMIIVHYSLPVIHYSLYIILYRFRRKSIVE